MKAKVLFFLLIGILALGLSTACSKAAGPKNDAQVASDVQSKVFSDPNVQSRQISVQAANGVVTLSGNVNSEAERAAAANAAAGVEGVKTVVNNLQVQSAAATPAPTQDEAQQTGEVATETKPARNAPREPAHRPSARRSTGTAASNIGGGTFSRENTGPSYNGNVASNVAPAAPPAPKKVTIPAGTNLSIRLVDGLDSERNQVGDQFKATLNAPVVVEDDVVIPQDADIQGRVVDVKSAGRFAGQSTLVLELTSVSFNGRTYNISTNQWSRSGTGRGKSTAAKVGGGAAIGAIIGGLAGGGKGAAIGATVGAGAGTGVSAATKGQQIKLGSEALLSFTLQNPLTVTAAGQIDRNRNRQPMND